MKDDFMTYGHMVETSIKKDTVDLCSISDFLT